MLKPCTKLHLKFQLMEKRGHVKFLLLLQFNYKEREREDQVRVCAERMQLQLASQLAQLVEWIELFFSFLSSSAEPDKGDGNGVASAGARVPGLRAPAVACWCKKTITNRSNVLSVLWWAVHHLWLFWFQQKCLPNQDKSCHALPCVSPCMSQASEKVYLMQING